MDTEQTLTTHSANELAQSLVRQNPQIHWSDQSGQTVVRVIRERTVIGSAPNADLVLVDKTVSRLHADLERRDTGLWVRDLGSRNGTYVENILVHAARIPVGGRLRLGRTELLLSDATSPAAVELWPNPSFFGLIGPSARMRELFATLARVAQTSATVLIEGETGTGKELAARAIHDASVRADKPFIVVDCGALPAPLLESELFGHAKGAYTDAKAARAGALEEAHGGTVFLDEVGELPLEIQPKLLRALESRAIKRLGESRYRTIDVRFISATHRDLRTMTNERTFREDLYFRLAVLPVTIPPLRERLADLPALVEHFFSGSTSQPVTAELLRQLLNRPWVGNVRELKNFLDRVSALGTKTALELDSFPSKPSTSPARWQLEIPDRVLEMPLNELRETVRSAAEREYLQALLRKHGRNVSEAAKHAGLNRTYLHRLIAKYEL